MRILRRTVLGVTVLVGLNWLVSPARGLDLGQLLGNTDTNNFKLVHVADLQALMAGNAPVYIYDANGADTRDEYGVIPRAKLLDSDDNYDVSVLPPNKDAKLVFYCANAH